jgi:transcriptional regulator with XRE-family HTH domain
VCHVKSNGEAIRAIRERTGMSVTELHRAANVDRTVLTRIEKGERNGTPAQLVAIAKALDVPITAITIARFEAGAA